MSSERTFKSTREVHDYMKENNVLLKVDGLEQYFKMGRKQLKAVDGVSFEVKKGEVFGIVGESGCGKTTTGRSIIRLYDITGGSIFFEGQRICAGDNQYKEQLNAENKRYSEAKKTAKKRAEEQKAAGKFDDFAYVQELDDLRAAHESAASGIHAQIRSAHYDHKHCNEEYAAEQCRQIDEKYLPLLAAAEGEVKAAEEAIAAE